MILEGPYGPPNLGFAQKTENLSTLGHYCTDNKTIRNFLHRAWLGGSVWTPKNKRNIFFVFFV